MPNFDTSNLVTAQTMIDDRFAEHEMRMNPYPVTALMAGNTPFMVADLNTVKTRDDRPVEVHMMARTKRIPGNSRTHDHQGTIDDSFKVTPTWGTYRDVTRISLKLLNKSVFDFNTVLSNKLQQCMMNIIEQLEADNVAWAQTMRSQFSKALKGNVSFNAATDSIEVTASDSNKKRFYQLLKSAMRQNNYGTMLDVIADNILAVEAEFLAAQGSGNDTNTNFQFRGLNIAESNELYDPNYENGVVLAMPAKSICMLDWIPKENRTGWGDYNTEVGGYGTLTGFGFDFALHGYAQRANTAAANGDTQDVVMEFEVSLDVSRNKAPLSGNNGETVIQQVALKN